MTGARTRVKICGLTRAEDVHMLVDAGVDAIGMVFYPPSPRYVEPEHAARLRQAIPAFVSVTALFVNPDHAFVEHVISCVKPDLLQFHGEESAGFCNGFDRRYIKAFRAGAPGLDSADKLLDGCLDHKQAAAWLFDSYSSGYGGSGQSFDLSLLERVWATGRHTPAKVLSAGLNAAVVGPLIQRWAPYAVDVSSGVESAPGHKESNLVHAFMKAVHMADARRGCG